MVDVLGRLFHSGPGRMCVLLGCMACRICSGLPLIRELPALRDARTFVVLDAMWMVTPAQHPMCPLYAFSLLCKSGYVHACTCMCRRFFDTAEGPVQHRSGILHKMELYAMAVLLYHTNLVPLRKAHLLPHCSSDHTAGSQ